MASEVVWRAVTAVEKADRAAAMVGNERWRKAPRTPPQPTSPGKAVLERASAATEPDPGVCIVHIAPDLYKMLARHGAHKNDLKRRRAAPERRQPPD